MIINRAGPIVYEPVAFGPNHCPRLVDPVEIRLKHSFLCVSDEDTPRLFAVMETRNRFGDYDYNDCSATWMALPLDDGERDAWAISCGIRTLSSLIELSSRYVYLFFDELDTERGKAAIGACTFFPMRYERAYYILPARPEDLGNLPNPPYTDEESDKLAKFLKERLARAGQSVPMK